MFQGKGEMHTFWIVGEDREHRISRLKPPVVPSCKSPSLTQRQGRRPLHKVNSTPTMRSHQYRTNVCFDKDYEPKPNGTLPSIGDRLEEQPRQYYLSLRRKSSSDEQPNTRQLDTPLWPHHSQDNVSSRLDNVSLSAHQDKPHSRFSNNRHDSGSCEEKSPLLHCVPVDCRVQHNNNSSGSEETRV